MSEFLHSDDIEYFESLVPLAFAAAERHGLELLSIEPKRRPQTGYGNCYVAEKRIVVAVRDKSTKAFGGEWAGKRYRHEFVLETIGHELAHLRYPNHGAEFKQLEREVIATIKELAELGCGREKQSPLHPVVPEGESPDCSM